MCDTLKNLWTVAKLCNIEKPGLDGTPDRVYNFVKCGNVRDFMIMSSLKCWEERTHPQYPPVTITGNDVVTQSQTNSDNGNQINRQKQNEIKLNVFNDLRSK